MKEGDKLTSTKQESVMTENTKDEMVKTIINEAEKRGLTIKNLLDIVDEVCLYMSKNAKL